ncbi:HK97 gp10 family phage protein [Micromonospora sp. HNM0581]|uniref:HK97 gp10 family phage protein n=1 Tax=Micromonospora sp. HNM0581 TaxID=2716341 RepID=UPI00197C0A78|nr:HK97 gp10 family phage protein [Micromonospora sp. HNM0581]
MAVRTDVRIDLNAGEIRRLLYGPVGPVVRFIRSVARRVRTRAVLTCPVDTGRLRTAHREEVGVRAGRVYGFVENTAEYAAAVHDGTAAHVIRPRRPGGVLRFEAGGQVVFTSLVNHPGTKAQPWLREAMEDVARQEGFRLVRR